MVGGWIWGFDFLSAFVRRNKFMALDSIAAVILYDETASGFRAKDLCDRLALGLAGDVELRVNVWRTDVLKNPIEATLALSEAAAADLVVLALRSTTLVSTLVRQWLEDWGAAQHVEEAALVVLGGGAGDVLSPLGARQLQDFAASHGLKCFCQHEQALPGLDAGSGDARPHAVPVVPSLPEFPGSYFHWGLND